jgi:DNA replication protein DnaC
MTFESFDTGGLAQNEQALLVAQNFVDNFPRASRHGWVIGFHGEPRAGKTHLAVAILQACAQRYRPDGHLLTPQLLNLPKALRAERERYNKPELPSPLQEAKVTSLLALDDMGAEYQREEDTSRVSWLSEQLYDLLDERLMNNRPLVYTTNLSPSDMERRYDNEQWMRVLARLREAEITDPLEVLKVSREQPERAKAKQMLYASRSG